MDNNPISVEGWKELERKFARMPQTLTKNVRVEINNSMRDFQGEMQNRMRSPERGIASRNRALARSFHTVPATGNELLKLEATATIGGASAPYAVIQEFGGTVRPKNARHLAVPMAGALTAAGRLKQNMVGFLAKTPRVFVVKSKRTGRLVAFQRQTKTKAIPIATLRESVTLRPRLGFFATWRALEPARIARMRAAVASALGEKK